MTKLCSCWQAADWYLTTMFALSSTCNFRKPMLTVSLGGCQQQHPGQQIGPPSPGQGTHYTALSWAPLLPATGLVGWHRKFSMLVQPLSPVVNNTSRHLGSGLQNPWHWRTYLASWHGAIFSAVSNTTAESISYCLLGAETYLRTLIFLFMFPQFPLEKRNNKQSNFWCR